MPRRDLKLGGQLGASAWMLNGKMAADLTRTLPPGEIYRSTDQLRDAAIRAVEAITASERVPVLIADGTDRLLRLTDSEQKQPSCSKGSLARCCA